MKKLSFSIMASALLSLSCLAIDHKLTVTTGLFGTDQTNKDGWVTPWRLYYTSTYKNDHAKAIIDLETQTGILKGPVIGGFLGQEVDLSIRRALFLQDLGTSQTAMLAVGRVKANEQRKTSSKTPLPFSTALRKAPAATADAMIGTQYATEKSPHTVTLGYAETNTSNNTQPDSERIKNYFFEWVYQSGNHQLWSHLLKNQIRTVFSTDDYLAIGDNINYQNTTLSASIAMSEDNEVVGYDLGITQKHHGNRYGIGYAANDAIHHTIELSAQLPVHNFLDITLGWYQQKPEGDKSFQVAGIKLTYNLS